MADDKRTNTVAATYDTETTMPNEVVTRCPYPGCNTILFKGILGHGTNTEVMCRHCRNYTRFQVT